MWGSGSVFGIRIQVAPEYGSNTDPDPQHCVQERERPDQEMEERIEREGDIAGSGL